MNISKKALITGITGQDGSYLAEFLLAKGYEVHGVIRRSSSFNTSRIDALYQDPHVKNRTLFLHFGDLSDGSSLYRLISEIKPDEVYNLGAQSHVKVSFEIPEYTGDVDAIGTLRLLDAIHSSGLPIKFYQAGSSEMFGRVLEIPQKETTPFYPRSPYACAKVFSHNICVNYRESYNMFICNGILFNHESERRGRTFVTKKITEALANIVLGNQETLFLGNLDSKRDWGYAKEYVEAMWTMLQQDTPDDFVIATGENHSVREFVEEASSLLGISLKWEGEGLQEVGIDKNTGKKIIAIDERYFRPTEVDTLLGDASKAKEVLGWSPKVGFKELVKIMIEAEFEEKGLSAKDYIKG